MIELQRCSDKEQWDDYVLENGGHPLQLWEWGQVKAGHGWKAERLFAYDAEGETLGAAQVLIRKLPSPFRSFAYIPRGPLFHVKSAVKYKDEILDTLAQFVKREHHSVVLSIEPDVLEFEKPDGWVRSTNKILSAETILLDLTKTESDLLAGMAKKTRQYIRKSASDITVQRVRKQEDIEACLAIYKQTAHRAGFNLHNERYYLDVFLQMQDYSPIFAAYVEGKPVAFLWLAISESTAYELYGGMDERGQELRANYALKWYAIRKVKEWGLTRYDFGGLVAGGVSNFKQGWSDDVTVFAGTFDRPLSPLYTLWSKGLPFAKRTLQRIRRKK
ncbi:MAG TPA: peptidoglycan bridge formation glycyltransferase FemA/FemB family protein [Dongiaceae bacterium]|nr:peptidoglycan bridge formation glycyltransferase FemA/FemB family protein [Dongiaceae bacterium]